MLSASWLFGSRVPPSPLLFGALPGVKWSSLGGRWEKRMCQLGIRGPRTVNTQGCCGRGYTRFHLVVCQLFFSPILGGKLCAGELLAETPSALLTAFEAIVSVFMSLIRPSIAGYSCTMTRTTFPTTSRLYNQQTDGGRSTTKGHPYKGRRRRWWQQRVDT